MTFKSILIKTLITCGKVNCCYKQNTRPRELSLCEGWKWKIVNSKMFSVCYYNYTTILGWSSEEKQGKERTQTEDHSKHHPQGNSTTGRSDRSQLIWFYFFRIVPGLFGQTHFQYRWIILFFFTRQLYNWSIKFVWPIQSVCFF